MLSKVRWIPTKRETDDYLSVCAIFGGKMMIEALILRLERKKEMEINMLLEAMNRVNQLLNQKINMDDCYEQSVQIQMGYDVLIEMCRQMMKQTPKKILDVMDVLEYSKKEQLILKSFLLSINESDEGMTWKELFSQRGTKELEKRKQSSKAETVD